MSIADRVRTQAREQQDKRDNRGSRMPRFKWTPGRSVVRIRTFEHEINEFDHQRPDCDFLTNKLLRSIEVGEKIELPVVPCFVFRQRGEVFNFVVGHDGPNCPAWQAWEDAGKPNGDAPKWEWMANVVDVLNPERGNMVVALRSEWRGPRTQGRNSVLTDYGIEHLWLGFDPDKQDAISSLQAFDGYGDKLFAKVSRGKLKGYDITVIKKADVAFGRECAVVDQSAKGGPIQAEEGKPLDASVFGDPIDLLSLPGTMPGYSHDGKHKTPVAASFVSHVGGRVATKVTEAAERPAETRTASAPSMGGVPRQNATEPNGNATDGQPAVGDWVTFEDEGVQIVGKINRIDGDAFEIGLDPDGQRSKDARAKVERFLREYTAAVMPAGACTVNKPDSEFDDIPF